MVPRQKSDFTDNCHMSQLGHTLSLLLSLPLSAINLNICAIFPSSPPLPCMLPTPNQPRPSLSKYWRLLFLTLHPLLCQYISFLHTSSICYVSLRNPAVRSVLQHSLFLLSTGSSALNWTLTSVMVYPLLRFLEMIGCLQGYWTVSHHHTIGNLSQVCLLSFICLKYSASFWDL